MTHLIEAVRGREAAGARTHHGHRHTTAVLGDTRRDPPLLPRTLDNGILDVLDSHGLVHQTSHASTFARGGADQAGKLREVVGLVKAVNRLLPLALVHQLVPFGNQVIDRAAVLEKVGRWVGGWVGG